MEESKFPSWSITFNMECDEKAVEFFKRMDEEQKLTVEAIEKRIMQMFKEKVKISGDKADEAWMQCYNLFKIGYAIGWNDCHEVFDIQMKGEAKWER